MLSEVFIVWMVPGAAGKIHLIWVARRIVFCLNQDFQDYRIFLILVEMQLVFVWIWPAAAGRIFRIWRFTGFWLRGNLYFVWIRPTAVGRIFRITGFSWFWLKGKLLCERMHRLAVIRRPFRAAISCKAHGFNRGLQEQKHLITVSTVCDVFPFCRHFLPHTTISPAVETVEFYRRWLAVILTINFCLNHACRGR